MSLHSGCANEFAIDALVEVLEARDSYTAGHGVRVAEYSIELGERLDLPKTQIQTLRLGGRLHDVGKVGIPDSILLKADRLTDLERGVMHTHTSIGRRILARLRACDDLIAVVELHHENWDGSGYPYRLKGDEIPLIARIVRVVDSFDAMTTNRIYRPALSIEEAKDRIVAASGRDYDPQVVTAFEAVLHGAGIHDFLPHELALA